MDERRRVEGLIALPVLPPAVGQLAKCLTLSIRRPRSHSTSPQSDHVRIVVFDVTGREVGRLLDGFRSEGRHRVTFEGGNLPSGVYLYRVETEKAVQVRSMVLLK